MTQDERRGIPGQPPAAALPRRKDWKLDTVTVDFNEDGATACAYYEDGGDLQHDFAGPRALEAAAAYVMQLCLDEQGRQEDERNAATA